VRNFINTAATDPAKARTVGLAQLTIEPFPVLIVGTKPTMEFVFANRGTAESWSGATDYTLRATIARIGSAPILGTFGVTIGAATLTLPYDFDAAGLQKALNDNATVTTDGGVDVVEQGVGRFLIGYRAVGAVTAFTVDPALLMPDCEAEIVVLNTGDATERQLTMLTLRRELSMQTEAFSVVSTPYAGWSGTFDLTGAAAKEFLRLDGEPVGQFVEADTLLTVEAIDASGNTVFTYQTPVTLRGLNYSETAEMDIGPTRTAQTNASGDSTVTPASQIHTDRITFSGSAGTRNVVIASPSGLSAGARIDILALFTGDNGIRVKIYALSTAGTLLFDFTRDGDEANALFTVYANGSGGFDRKEQTIPAFPSI
jgi:hypothetical protein